MSRVIEYLPLSGLRGNPANPKAHALDVVEGSIGRFGVIEPVVRDERTGMLVSGHGRTETLQSMEERGDTPPDGVQVDAAGAWLVPVVTGWSSRSDAEAGAALIALNRAGEIGGWVDDALLDLLDDLGEELTGVGFDAGEIASLRRHLDDLALLSAGGEDDEDLIGGEDLDEDPIDITKGQHTLTVLIEVEHREEFYALMSSLDWVIDARDAARP